MCCSPRGHKESDTIERLNNNNVRGSMAMSPSGFWVICNVGLKKNVCVCVCIYIYIYVLALFHDVNSPA